MGYWRGLLIAVILTSCILTVTSFNFGMSNPCKSGYFLRNPYTWRPFFCMKFCPWPKYYKCESMTGSDDGWGVCCFNMGDV